MLPKFYIDLRWFSEGLNRKPQVPVVKVNFDKDI